MIAVAIIQEKFSLLKKELENEKIPSEKRRAVEATIKSLELNVNLDKLTQETLFEFSLALGDLQTNLFTDKFGEARADVWEIALRKPPINLKTTQ